VSHQVLEHYSQQLQQLILDLSHLSEPEADSLTLEIVCVEQVKTEPSHEQEQQQLTEQIREFWTESQVVYDEVLATKRIETGDETLTWERYTRSTWEFLKKVRGSDVDKDYQVYTRDYINGLGKNRLAKLASFQALPPEVSSLLGWLTPNYKLALLKQLCALQQIDVGAQTDEAMLEDEALITQAAASLAHKILLNRAQQPPATRLGFEFGADLPDTPQNDRVKLKHWGNLSFTKISPWEQPLVMCRTQSQTPIQIKTGETERSKHSTPELHGLALKPAPENVVAITTTAELSFQDHQIDIPVRYLPASWLIETIKVCMEGNRD
jgi:hypothetical protein